MDPLDQKLDYKMSGLATATKKRHLDPAWFSWFVNDGRWPSRRACSPTTCALSNPRLYKKNEWCGWPGMKTPLRPCRVLDHQDWKKKNVLHQEVCNTSKKKIVSLYCTHPTILQPPDFTPKALLILCQHQGDGRIRRNDASDPVALMLWTKRVVSDSFSPCLGFRKVLRMLLGLGGPQGAPGGPRMLEGHECCSLRLYLQPEKKPLVMRCHNQQGWWTSTFIPWILMKNFRGKPAKNVQEKNDPICGSKFLPIQSL